MTRVAPAPPSLRPLRSAAAAALVAISALAPAPATADPVPLVVAVDTSRSLSDADLAAALSRVADELSALPADTPAGVLAFAEEARWLAGPGAPLAEAREALGGIRATGSLTLLRDALFTAGRTFTDGGVVLLVSDGRDEGSATTVEDVARLAATHGMRILPLPIGRQVDDRALRRLALLTEGALLGPDAGAVGAAVASAREDLSTRRPAAEPTSAVPAPATGPPPPPDVAEPLPPVAETPSTGPATWPWPLVAAATGLLVLASLGIALWARRRPAAAGAANRYCDHCGSDLDPATGACPRCAEEDLARRLGATPATRLEDTAELAVVPPVPPPPSGEDAFDRTRVLADHHVLLVRPPQGEERSFVLRAGSAFAVGRTAEGNTLAVPDPSLSAHHLKVVPEEGWFYAVDLGSTNGTFVNGERVQARRLRSGDRIRAGMAELEYRLVAQPLG